MLSSSLLLSHNYAIGFLQSLERIINLCHSCPRLQEPSEELLKARLVEYKIGNDCSETMMSKLTRIPQEYKYVLLVDH